MAFRRYTQVKQLDALYKDVTIADREGDLFVEFNSEDKLENLAYRVYNDPSMWWIIMLANPEYAMEYEIEPGETLRVPLPLNSVITEIKNQVS